MVIDSSNVGMESARRYSSSSMKYSRFHVKEYSNAATDKTGGSMADLLNAGEENSKEETNETNSNQNSTTGMLSRDAIDELRNRVESMRNTNIRIKRVSETGENVNDIDSMRQYSIRYIFALLFGKDKVGSLTSEETGTDTSVSGSDAYTQLSQATMGTTAYLSFQTESFYYESEEATFQSVGNVKTADGREISFHVNVSMSREFSEYYSEEIQMAQIQTCDPLVINFDAGSASISDQNFFFDIDADGKEDEIANLSNGSGYLALDKNKDGSINDGSELFGPESGNGFADLSKYDEDGNGWIDEADSVWSDLKIWCHNEDGTDSLYTLKEKGVGAICLQKADTDFEQKNSNGETKAFVRNTGIFLYENGNVGTVQHLDMVR